MGMIEDKVIGVPKSYFDSVKDSVDLVEKAMRLWRDNFPQEAAQFDDDMDRFNAIAGTGSAIAPMGKIPAKLFGLIHAHDKDFFRDPKNMRIFFKTYSRAAVRREVRKILVTSGIEG